MSQQEQVPQEPQSGQRKRSKRHRMKRNNISDKDRVQSAKDFGVYARQVHKDYLANLTPKHNTNPFL